jgi:hypothetical protein
MRMHAKRRLAGLALFGSFVVAVGAVGCSLGLDKSKIGPVENMEGGGSDGPQPEGSSGEAGDGPTSSDGKGMTDAPPQASAGACTKDSDCQAGLGDAGGCVTSAKCDPTWHVCMLDVCNAGPCKAEECNTSTNTCTLPSDYSGTFNPTSFVVQYGGVGTSIQWAISAVWPFVFLITTNGVIAYDVFDPTNNAPPAVTIHGVPFIPNYTLAIGRRVYFLTDEVGNGPTYRQAIAWIDVPQNPFINEFTANTAWVGTNEKNGLAALVNDGVNGFFMSYSTTPLLPTAQVHAPLTDGTTIMAFPNNNFPKNAYIMSASGQRLLAYSYDGAKQAAQYAMVTSPGTAGATTGSLQIVGSMGPIENQQAWAQGADGSVLWEAAPFQIVDGGSSGQIDQACLTWLLDSSTATSFDAAKCATLESYSPPVNQQVTVTPAWIDANTALGVAAASSNPSASTSVHVVKNKPSLATVPGVVSYVPVGPSSVGTTSSNGFGYVLAQTDTMNQTCTIYVFAPACTGGGG